MRSVRSSSRGITSFLVIVVFIHHIYYRIFRYVVAFDVHRHIHNPWRVVVTRHTPLIQLTPIAAAFIAVRETDCSMCILHLIDIHYDEYLTHIVLVVLFIAVYRYFILITLQIRKISLCEGERYLTKSDILLIEDIVGVNIIICHSVMLFFFNRQRRDIIFLRRSFQVK